MTDNERHAQMLYGPGQQQALEQKFSEHLTELGDATGMPLAEQQAEVQAFGQLAQILGLPYQDAVDLHQIYARERLTPATDEEIEARGREARQRGREQHGAIGFEQQVAQVKAGLLTRVPMLKTILDETPGLANHERAVQILIEAARRAG